MTDAATLASRLRERFAGVLSSCQELCDEVTIEMSKTDLRETCLALRDEPAFEFKQLMDVCAVDYLGYGQAQWETKQSTTDGFDRAVERRQEPFVPEDKKRFAVVYHLLSLSNNQRLRIKVLLKENELVVDSVIDVWSSANWFEREVYDLFGILFTGHPDLRRILTDYGFVGHPFRKDFPLSGYVEVRYDAEKGRVIYAPVDIEPRVLVPKVIREDSCYLGNKNQAGKNKDEISV